jgi:two-component system alkaline phosphatase synthesis response regulator PhoP
VPKILIVEDEPDLARGVAFNLEARGYEVVVARDGERGYQAALAERPDLVLLDVMLPKRDGYDVCRALRKAEPRLPIVMLTAKGQEDDVVLGLKLGADDYVKKPFGVAELVARIETVLRRSAGAGGLPDRIVFGDVTIDFVRHVAMRAGQPIDLTPKEFDILRYFGARRGTVVSRDALLDAVWRYDATPNTRTVDAHIVKLRQKIEPEPSSPRHLLTVHGLGYKFVG